MPATNFVADAHDRIRTTLRQWLEVGFPHYHAIELLSVEGALARAHFQGPNPIIIDIGFSSQSGIVAIRRIKALRQEILIVVLTFIVQDNNRAEAMEARAAAFISTSKMHEKLILLLSKLLPKVQA